MRTLKKHWKILGVFSSLIFFLLFSLFAMDDRLEVEEPKKTTSHASSVNTNLGLNSVNVPSLLNCDWSGQGYDYSDEDLLSKSRFNNADCTSYFPSTFGTDFFIYFKGITSINSSGIVLETQVRDSFGKLLTVIPKIKESTTFDSYRIIENIQEHMDAPNEANSSLSLFSSLSAQDNSLGLLFTMDKAHKIAKLKLGGVKVDGAINFLDVNFKAATGSQVQMFAGYLNEGETLSTTISKINDGTLTESNSRFTKFFDKKISATLIDRTIQSENDFTKDGIGVWNTRAFGQDTSITSLGCQTYTREKLGITNSSGLELFCSHLAKSYKNTTSSKHFYINVNNFPYDNPIALEANIDGNFPLGTQVWDVLFFPMTKLVMRDFPYSSLGNDFIEKFQELHLDRGQSSKLKEVSFVNIGLTDETFVDDIKGLWANLIILKLLDLSENKLSFERIQDSIQRAQVERLTLLNTFASTDVFDLSSQLKLISLKLSGNSIETLILNSPDLETLEASGLGLRNVIGLEKSTTFNKIDLSSNNLTAITLNRNAIIQDLDLSKNLLETFELNDGQQIRIINLSNNQISTFSSLNNLLLEELKIENNNLGILRQRSTRLKKIYARGNKITVFSIIFNSITHLDLSENIDIASVLNTASFSSNNLQSLILQDVKLSSINNSWFGNKTQGLTLDLSNKNSNNADDNTLNTLDLSEITNLNDLKLSNVGLTSFTYKDGSLDNLDLSNNQLTKLDFGTTTITSLSLKFATKSKSLIDAVISLKDSIVSLDLSNTGSSWNELFSGNQFPNLSIINLASNNLDDAPSYLAQFRGRLLELDLSNNNLQDRYDLFGYTLLKKLNLANNDNLLALINLDKAFSLEELNVSGITKSLARITEGSDSLLNLNISNSKIVSLDEMSTRFPNLESLDISGNPDLDISTLANISAENISASSDASDTADILKTSPKVQDVSLLGIEFNLLDFTTYLNNPKSVYRIFISRDLLVLEGDDSTLLKWFREFSFKKVFLLDEEGENIYLNDLIINKTFDKAKEKYSISDEKIEEQKKAFESSAPLLNTPQYENLKKQMEISIGLNNFDEVVATNNRLAEYENGLANQIKGEKERLESFEVTIYTLIGLSLVMLIGIVAGGVILFRVKRDLKGRR